MGSPLTGFLYAASKDLSALEVLRRDSAREHAEAIAFHSQQAAEKLLKNVFLENGIPAPRTHDLVHLIELAQGQGWLTCTREEIEAAMALSDYAVAARYEFSPEIGEGEALQAIAFCKRIAQLVARNGFPSAEVASTTHLLRDDSKDGDSETSCGH